MDEPVVQCYGGLGDLENRKWRTEADNGVHRERDGRVNVCSELNKELMSDLSVQERNLVNSVKQIFVCIM